jgi:hypothetical protein
MELDFVKKRIFSLLLLVALTVSMLPGALAADADKKIPIYIGYADVDFMAREILKEIPTAGKTDVEQIRAVYNWIIQNNARYEWDGTYYFDETEVEAQVKNGFYDLMLHDLDSGKAVLRQEYAVDFGYENDLELYDLLFDENGSIAGLSYSMMMRRVGDCTHFSSLLALLLGHLGFDCRVISGGFVNRNGTAVMHKWNYVCLNGSYHWLDVRIDHAAYSGGKVSNRYFLEHDTSKWEANHVWDRTYSDWLQQNAAFIAEQYAEEADSMANQPWTRCSAWAKDVVSRGGETGLIPAHLCRADFTADIPRAEYAAIAVNFYEALGGEIKAVPGENPFSDTDDPAVLTGYSLGIVNGTGDGKFSPDATLTREQAVTMLGRAFELARTGTAGDGETLLKTYGLGSDFTVFSDAGEQSDYARQYIAFFSGHGIVKGMGDGRFAPRDTMTREQAVKVAVETISSFAEQLDA